MYVQMGGVERLVYNLVCNLDRNIFSPNIAWLLGDEVCKEFRELKVPLYHTPKIKRVDISTMRNISRIIKKENIDIVNAHGFINMVYSFYGCKIKNRKKLFYTVHSNWEIQQIPKKWKKIGTYLLNNIDGTIIVNPSFAESLRKVFKVNPSKQITIPNGVDIMSFESNIDKLALKKKTSNIR